MKKLKPENRDRLEQEAVAWHVRLTSGELNADDSARFEEWRTRSAAHNQAYQKIVSLWDQLGTPLLAYRKQYTQISDESIGKPPSAAGHAPSATKIANNNHWAMGLAIAAAFVLVAAFGLYHDYLLNPWADYRTHIGEQTTITLADGSVIYLNTDSAINTTITDHGRHVDLLQGEAEFEVAHDSTRPFTVTSGQVTTQAIGTRFLVRYDGIKGLVTLLEGKIRASATPDQARPRNEVMLTPGDQVAFNENRIGVITQTDIAMADAWKTGRLLMNFATLQHVITEINRYRRGTVQLLDKQLAARQLNVAIDLNQTDNWLDALQDSLPLHVHRLGPLILIKSE